VRVNVALQLSIGSSGEIGVVNPHGGFAWYELLTTDVAAAKAFYGSVVGWETQEASTTDLAYHLFTTAQSPVGGLMDLPQEARRMGATPRWIGYVGVDDVDAVADRIKRLGGAVYVPPTDSNIGRISIVADPQTASLALVKGLKIGAPQPWKPAELGEPGRVGWHELLAADWKKAFAFYGGLFGWQATESEAGPTDTYQLFSAGGRMMGGIFTKRPVEPVPFWLYYFNVSDIDAATARVKRGGGRVFEGPFEVPGGSWIVRCIDPQGAIFALQGTRSQESIKQAPASEFGWSTEWGGFSSRGRLLVDTNKPRGKGRK
jgi:predicted enzyme related to lactoylglutathione lyase